MKIFNLFCFFVVFLFCCTLNSSGWAESSVEEDLKAMKAEFEAIQKKFNVLEETVARQQKQINAQEQTKQAYETRIKDLEEQLAAGAGSQSTSSLGRTPAPKWLPDIGVVADVVYTQNSAKTDAEGSDRVSLRELELVFGSDIDPYSRLDATISFSDLEAPSLEEAYMTRFGLPFDATARLGKFKPKVGKVLALHRDSLDTVDEPLVIQRYFGVEGMSKSGLDFSKTLNLPLPVTQQISFGILEGGNGEEGTAFGETKRRPTLYSHLKNYLDITDETGIELGLSHMAGSRDMDSHFEVQVLGIDTTFTHQFTPTQSLKIQTEAFNLNRRETPEELDGNLWGAYGLVDLRFHPQWSAGVRYDVVEPVDLDRATVAERQERGIAGYLTFYQSEFARWRLQVSHTDLTTGKDDNAVYLQGTFAIGEHKHKLQ